MKKFLCIVVVCLGVMSLCAAERNQNIKVILEKTYLVPQSEPLLNMLALQAISLSGKDLSSADAIKQFREVFYTDAVCGELAKAYDFFSDSELEELRKVHESVIFQKYSKNAAQIIQKNFATLSEAFRGIVDKHGVEIPQEDAGSEDQ